MEKNRNLVTLILLLFSLIVLASDLYTNALGAYISGDYKRALELFEEALQEDPTIEERDPFVKLKMGICAYAIGDYEKARAYLSSFPDNVIAQEILKKLNVTEEEWEKYVKAKAPIEKQESEKTSIKPSIWMLVVVSGGTFVVVYFLQRLIVTRLLKKPKVEEVIEERHEEIEEEPEAVLKEPPLSKGEEKLEEKLDVLEELLGGIEEKRGKATEGEDVDVDEVLKKAKAILESSEEVPDDKTAEEINLDVDEVLKELESKEQYDEEDAKKLVLVLKKKLEEE
ncbi:tetratricopeptide repeat protein [Thermotoga sp. KOL6]|uniref:tetratricopeptide repeat protein n=1 Tax=Thermotoga sp. KOL6 TaxID=126741 RepID=UPI000C7763E5|nr:tetratricopeptide repeat protein [Thermotoga sp. KOL6]